MRLPFRTKEDAAPRWVDSAALGWTPEEPLDLAPRPKPDNDTSFDGGWVPEPRAAVPEAKPVPVPDPEIRAVHPTPEPEATLEPTIVPEPDIASALMSEVHAVQVTPEREPEVIVSPELGFVEAVAPEIRDTEPAPEPITIPEPGTAPKTISWSGIPLPEPQITTPERPPVAANSNRAAGMLLPRLGIGLAQGMALYLLLQAREAQLWPGNDPAMFSALLLAALLAPLTALDALGEIENRLLALWSGTIAFVLASLGLYQQWRMPDAQLHLGVTPLLPILLALMIAQVLFKAALRDGKPVAAYRLYREISWTLAARLLIWAALTGTAFALMGSGTTLFNGLHSHYPAAALILPLLGLVSAGVFEATTGAWMRQATDALILYCTLALPMLVIAALAALMMAAIGSPLPLVAVLVLGAALITAVNASYRGEASPFRWQKGALFAGAVMVTALAAFAGISLGIRVGDFGWTAERVIAACAVAGLALYGLAYTAAALISLGGGAWMKGVERANLVLALVMAGICLDLSTPLADPLQQAVQSQTARLGHMDPAAFDFTWLNRSGRFGHDALLTLSRDRNPEIARNAAVALAAPPQADAPAPTEIGANITVRTAGERLPSSLLEQNWTGAAVPPCLTKAALACDAWFLDLDGDGKNEIVLVYGNDARWWASVMKQDILDRWSPAATLASPCRGSLAAMRAHGIALADPHSGWRDVLVAGMRLSPSSASKAELPCPG
jgi:hypothetical protein